MIRFKLDLPSINASNSENRGNTMKLFINTEDTMEQSKANTEEVQNWIIGTKSVIGTQAFWNNDN